jgi:hypothetical protein
MKTDYIKDGKCRKTTFRNIKKGQLAIINEEEVSKNGHIVLRLFDDLIVDLTNPDQWEDGGQLDISVVLLLPGEQIILTQE